MALQRRGPRVEEGVPHEAEPLPLSVPVVGVHVLVRSHLSSSRRLSAVRLVVRRGRLRKSEFLLSPGGIPALYKDIRCKYDAIISELYKREEDIFLS